MGREVLAAPVLKWAGGKTRLIDQIRLYLPSQPRNYYVEPFIGGGALLFWMLNNYGKCFKRVIANDNNQDLVMMYKTIQSDVESLIDELEGLTQGIRTAKDPKEFYLARRAEYNQFNRMAQVRHSALLIFLNKMCFNGLYRVNQKGEFNVPYGARPSGTIYSPEVLRKNCEVLKRVTFKCGDYSRALVSATNQEDAFYYFDPPYRPLSLTSSFNQYTKDSFDEEEQIRLAEHCCKLNKCGAYVMVSNSDTTITNPQDDFYEKHFPRPDFVHHRILAPRTVSANPLKRGATPEVLIVNYKP